MAFCALLHACSDQTSANKHQSFAIYNPALLLDRHVCRHLVQNVAILACDFLIADADRMLRAYFLGTGGRRFQRFTKVDLSCIRADAKQCVLFWCDTSEMVYVYPRVGPALVYWGLPLVPKFSDGKNCDFILRVEN
jgi:hypothetical protein